MRFVRFILFSRFKTQNTKKKQGQQFWGSFFVSLKFLGPKHSCLLGFFLDCAVAVQLQSTESRPSVSILWGLCSADQNVSRYCESNVLFAYLQSHDHPQRLEVAEHVAGQASHRHLGDDQKQWGAIPVVNESNHPKKRKCNFYLETLRKLYGIYLISISFFRAVSMSRGSSDVPWIKVCDFGVAKFQVQAGTWGQMTNQADRLIPHHPSSVMSVIREVKDILIDIFRKISMKKTDYPRWRQDLLDI